MVTPQEDQSAQISYLLANFNTRLRELEDRNRMLKERISLLSKNLISLKEENQKEVMDLKETLSSIKQNLEKLKDSNQSILSETDNFVRKSEIIPVERMLHDFTPLEFARKKELEELRQELRPLAMQKTIKTAPPTKIIEKTTMINPQTIRTETTKTLIPDKRKKDVEDLLSRIKNTKNIT